MILQNLDRVSETSTKMGFLSPILDGNLMIYRSMLIIEMFNLENTILIQKLRSINGTCRY